MAKRRLAVILAVAALVASARTEAASQALNAIEGRLPMLAAAGGCAECLHAVVSRPGGGFVHAHALLHSVNLFDRDKREYVSQTGENQRYAPIFRTRSTHDLYDENGRLGKGEATGFMISPCFAAVNAHAVFGMSAPPELRGKARWASGKDFGISFLSKRDANGALLPIAEQPVAHPIGSDSSNGWVDDASRDYAVVKFKKGECPGEDPKVGWTDLVDVDWRKLVGVKMNMAGFPVDRDENRLSIERGCTFRGFDETGPAVSHTCGTVPRASGSPIFGEINGRLKVVALNVGTNGSAKWDGKADIVPEGSPSENFATMLTEFMEDAHPDAHQDFVDHGIKDIPDWAK